MNESNETRHHPVLPPWLWFWIVLFLWNLPGHWNSLLALLNDLFAYKSSVDQFFPQYKALRLMNIAEVAPDAAVLLGVLTVFFPWMRASRLRKKWQLQEIDDTLPAEISEFIATHAPSIRISGNLLRTDQFAFVYPLSYRRYSIALFGGIVKLWRTDRKGAQAILLHEIAHYRQGDALIIGVGSFFELLIQRWLSIYLLFCVLPLLIAWSGVGFNYPAMIGKGFFSISLGLLFNTLNVILMPMLAIWLAELQADRIAIRTLQSADEIERLLQASMPKSGWQRLLSQMAHPPLRIRRWFAASAINGRLLPLLLLFPLAYVGKLLVFLGKIIFGAGTGLQHVPAATGAYLGQLTYIELFLAAMILFWPKLARYWEVFFTGNCLTCSEAERKEYLTAAIVAGGLTIIMP